LSVFPGLVISEHCGQDDDEFSHDGGNDDLEGLSPAGEPFGKTAEDSVRTDGGESGHIEASADLASPGEDPSFSALLAAVTIIGASPASATAAGLGIWPISGKKAKSL